MSLRAMEEYQSNARVLHLSLLLTMSCVSLVPRPKIAFTMAESTCCRFKGPQPLLREAYFGLGMPDEYFGKSGGGGNE